MSEEEWSYLTVRVPSWLHKIISGLCWKEVQGRKIEISSLSTKTRELIVAGLISMGVEIQEPQIQEAVTTQPGEQ
jgi:hypothetical protein